MPEDNKSIQPIPLLSHFRTTVRNELHTWVAHTVIYAAYFSIVHFFLDFLVSQKINFNWYLLFLLSTFPVLIQLLTWNFWTMGFKSRTQHFFVSILILSAFYLRENETTLSIFWIVTYLHLGVFMIRRLVGRKRHAPDVMTYILTFGIVFLGYIGAAYGKREWIHAHLPMLELLMFLLMSAFAIVPLLQTWENLVKIIRSKNTDRSKSFKNTILNLFIRSIFYSIGLSMIYLDKEGLLSLLSATAIFLYAAGPGLAISRQKTHFVALLNWFGINNLSTPVTTEPMPSGLINIQLDYIKKYIEQNRQYVSIVLVFALSLMSVIFIKQFTGLITTTAELITFGITMTFSMGVIYLSFWFVRNRKKHIVMPFVVAEGQNEAQLQSLANLMTYAFVQQLRYMALLLSMKQVENIASRNDNTLPVFATSGQEKNLIEQVRSLGDVEIANTKIPFGGLLAFLGNSAAHTRVIGTVVRQKDDSIAVLVEFIQRGGQVVNVDMDFVPETSAVDLDEKIITTIARSLAVKLVVKLGNHPYLASSWKSMLNFLNGLDAAYRKNWWQAITFYRRSIQDEEATNGPAGPGYYHLGASLISQGNIADGYNYLRIAEKKNAPQAEVQYMIALTQFYMFHDFLHLERAIFEDIKWRCSLALERRPYFPEVHHLLGTVYYQRGKLLERSFTKVPKEPDAKYSQIEVLPQDYPGDYKSAIRHLSKAIHGYNRALRLLPKDIVAHNTVFDERSKMVQYKMSATHRYGDALRSLERYSEADAYYQKTLFAYPLNIRTLVDRAKTFCFSGNWQQADQSIRYDIFNNEEYRSNKSANFYMGWALSGGLVDEYSKASRFTDVFIRWYEGVGRNRRIDQIPIEPRPVPVNSGAGAELRHPGRNRVRHLPELDDIGDDLRAHVRLFGRSMLFLDYAIHQYPKYIHRWKQTNWFDDFEQAAGYMLDLKSIKPEDLNTYLYSKPLGNTKIYHIGQIYYWLCWRAASTLPLNSQDIDDTFRIKIGWTSIRHLRLYIPNHNFYKLFRYLVLSKASYEKILEVSDKHGVICDLETRLSKFKLGRKMHRQWYESAAEIEKIIAGLMEQNAPKITFADRWIVDIFAEFSMLVCHVLAEANAYETAVWVGKRSSMILKDWIELWNRTMPADFFFSSKLLDYQLASINGWTAYSMFMGAQDYATQSRLLFLESVNRMANDPNRGFERVTDVDLDMNLILDLDIEKSQAMINDALVFMPNHPLALFVNALILEKKGHKTKAADELNQLLSHIAPFDPHVYSRRNSYIENIEVPNRKINKMKTDNAHQFLIYGERSCGDLQFTNVMSLSQIHVLLGKIANDLEEFRTSTGHMTQAFADTPYRDEQAEILIDLTEMLNRNGQYSNAIAVLDEANLRRRHLSPVDSPNAKSLQVVVMECVLMTNMEKYRDSLDRGLEISKNWGIIDLSNGYETILKSFYDRKILYHKSGVRFLEHYASTILSQFKEIEVDTKFEGIEKNKKKLIKLIEVLQEHTVINIINSVLLESPNSEAVDDSDLNQIDYDLVILTQVLAEMYRDIVLFVIQQCEWMNNCAFNYCELDFNIDKAENYSRNAIELMEDLEKVGNKLAIIDWKARQAQFYDTLAWIHYRKGGRDNLKIAFELLNVQALRCEQESPLIYYHLARVRLSQIENLWQDSSFVNEKKIEMTGRKASMISKYLRDAFLYWRHAHRLDKEKNLYLRLRIVRMRIDQYRKNWGKLNWPVRKKN